MGTPRFAHSLSRTSTTSGRCRTEPVQMATRSRRFATAWADRAKFFRTTERLNVVSECRADRLRLVLCWDPIASEYEETGTLLSYERRWEVGLFNTPASRATESSSSSMEKTTPSPKDSGCRHGCGPEIAHSGPRPP